MFYICINNFYFFLFVFLFVYVLLILSSLFYILVDLKKISFFSKNIYLHLSTLLHLLMPLIFNFVVFLVCIKSYKLNFFFNHFSLVSPNINVWILLMLVLTLIFWMYSCFFFINTLESIEFLIVVFNFFWFAPLLFTTNSMLTFIIVIEVIALISNLAVINGLAASSLFFKTDNFKTIKNDLNKNFNIINSLILNFWVSLISSLFFFLSSILTFLFFASSDWFFLEIIINLNVFINHSYILIFFIIGMFIKLAMPPFFLWKIIFFKNLPLHVLFFYVILFFPIVFLAFLNYLFFSNLLINFFNSIFILLVLILSIFSISSIFFSNLNFKVFISLSSSLNLLFIILILISFLNSISI